MNEAVRILACVALPFAAGAAINWWLMSRGRWRLSFALVATALSWAAFTVFVAARAHAGDRVPETTPDGYAVLLATFPAGAEKVCVIREDSPGTEPECRVPSKTPGRVSVAVVVRKLEPGSRYCAYAVKGGATSKLSEDCWVGVSVPRSKP